MDITPGLQDRWHSFQDELLATFLPEYRSLHGMGLAAKSTRLEDHIRDSTAWRMQQALAAHNAEVERSEAQATEHPRGGWEGEDDVDY